MQLDRYELDTYLLPFWKGEEVYHETITFVGEEDEAPLLYPPTEMICVRNFALDTVYEAGKDYSITKDGKIKRLKGSTMPYFETDEFYSKAPGSHAILVVEEKEGVRFPEPRYFAFGEKDFMNRKQIAVSYRHQSGYEGVIPPCKKERLPKTLAKLNVKAPFNFTFYGDSITTGCNASGLPQGGEVAPYMEGFDKMVCRRLENRFGAKITLGNGAVGGWNVVQGKERFSERAAHFSPDLLLIGFGMNDGARAVSEYKETTLDIIRQAREIKPDCEIILVGTTLPNPGSNWTKNQPHFVSALYEIEQELKGVAVADMTAVHKDLLNKKRYRDMTGNNINHPNDFLIRAYAQVILQTIAGI
ncbi:MAG: SGNH/GDSL hydrolase family protein [Clostridia bacterium]|nr:SGNH/GDSL hydrolase family protein [Clostridia bacterium]